MEIKFEIKKHYGTVKQNGAYSTEVNLVSWNGQPNKLDIRQWKTTEQGKQPLKGMTLDRTQTQALYDALTEVLSNGQ